MTRLLLAENDPTLAKILGYKFELKGFSVTIAPNGRAAWEEAQQAVFDLVITDYAMAEMNGDDLCRHLRGDRRYDQTPIIMISAFIYELDVDRLSEELRLAAFYPKPFVLAELTNKVEEVLTKCHA